MLRRSSLLTLLAVVLSTSAILPPASAQQLPGSFYRVCERINRRFTPGTTPYERVTARILKRFGQTCDGVVPEPREGSTLRSPDGRFVFEVKSVDEGYGSVYRFVLTDTESERAWTAQDFPAKFPLPERMSAVDDVVFTSDSSAVLFVASTWGRGQSLVVIDLTEMSGREIYPHRSVSHLTLSPDETIASYVASQQNGLDADPMEFVVTVEVRGSLRTFGDQFEAVTSPPTFSADSQTLTYIVSDRGEPLTITTDFAFLRSRCEEECGDAAVCSQAPDGAREPYCSDE